MSRDKNLLNAEETDKSQISYQEVQPSVSFPDLISLCGNGRTCLHQTPIEARPALAEASAGCQPDKREGGTRNSSVSLLPSYSKKWLEAS